MGFFGSSTRHGQTWNDELRSEEFALRLVESNRQNPRFPAVTDAEIQALKKRIETLRELAKKETTGPTQDVEIPAFLRNYAD